MVLIRNILSLDIHLICIQRLIFYFWATIIGHFFLINENMMKNIYNH